jgi:hypothetical protein
MPTLNAQGPPSGQDGDSASPGNEEANSLEAPVKVELTTPAKLELTTPVKVELFEGSIVMDTATFINRLVRVHPPIGIA